MSADIQPVIERAKRAAIAEGADELCLRHIILGMLADRQTATLLVEAGDLHADIPSELQKVLDQIPKLDTPSRKLPLGADFKPLFKTLYRQYGGMPPLSALAAAILKTESPILQQLRHTGVKVKGQGTGSQHEELPSLMEDVAILHNQLSRKVVGQPAAIKQISDAMFAAGLFDRSHLSTPAALLLFLGPPGVGKTYTAQTMAEVICEEDKEAFLRLDMSSYADPNAFRILVGFEPSYSGARPGLLTEHVQKHPVSVILVDEIEKAHPSIHNLFLQVLDSGRLEDKYEKKNVPFSGCIIIFTTNLGRDLYLAKNTGGVLGATKISRPQVLEALRSATHPLSGAPILSPEFCSRLAKGYPIFFQQLRPVHLEAIAELAVKELSLDFEKSLGVPIRVADPRVLMLMILRLGPDLDARTVSSGVPLMVMDAFRDFLTHHQKELFGGERHFERIRALKLALPSPADAPDIHELNETGYSVLVLCNPPIPTVLQRFRRYTWSVHHEVGSAIEMLRGGRIDFALLDAEFRQMEGASPGIGAARALRALRVCYPELRVFVYHKTSPITGEQLAAERLALANGAQGRVSGTFEEWAENPEESPLEDTRRAVLRESFIEETFRTRKTFEFEWEAQLETDDKAENIVMRPTDLRDTTLVASRDRAARLSFTGVPTERFSQIAGAVQAKERLREIISWMRDPAAIRSLGVDLPTGILLEGPPGNGKTLLARATAGEAGLPFFAANATDFASKWVGESEKNVRELFERAAAYAPSILFIDEIDAIGSRRSSFEANYHDQILTQLLVSMDGFTKAERPVFFLAATNRADLLDPALKRPGRFDYVITIDVLGLEARRELLTIALAEVPCAEGVDLDELARASWGLSGAQLNQVVKEAAIIAYRETGPDRAAADIRLTMDHLREALTNVKFGLRTENTAQSEESLRLTAIHEAGHALVAEIEKPGSVQQATILPRAQALGFVESVPEHELQSYTRKEIKGRIRTALAGRSAVMLVAGPDAVSAGCCNDLEVATRLACRAVGAFGMSDEFGSLSLSELQRHLPQSGIGDKVAEQVTHLVSEQESAVREMLTRYRKALDSIAEELMRTETLLGTEIRSIMKSNQAANREV